MIKYIVASCLLALVLGWSISTDDICSCDQQNIKSDCNYRFCKWNETISICQEDTCSGQTIYGCLSEYKNCYWNSTACNPFSDCESLSGNSTDTCKNQNYYCSWSSGSSCTLDQCSLYNTTNCPSQCYNSGSKCEMQTSCSQYNTSGSCPNNSRCTWSGGSCVATTCSMMSAKSCDYVESLYNEDWSFSLTPCFWNGTVCQDASPSDLNTTDLCKYNTYGLYHWSSANASDGSCIACYGIFVQALIVLMILLA